MSAISAVLKKLFLILMHVFKCKCVHACSNVVARNVSH